MYDAFYQLSADPFRLSPDPAFCFQHRTYRRAMIYMLHALHRAEGFIMITGQPGTGKTTLVNDLIRTLRSDQIAVAKIVSTQLTAEDLLNLVAYSFNLDPEGGGKAKVLVQVKRFLEQQYQHGRRPLLIVDEAQDMGEEALEELRLLTNILVGNHQLLQVFLLGQEQLRDTVNTPSLEQLNQRLIAATLLEPLNTDDTRSYIKHRLRCVSWKGDPLLSTETYAMIQRYSHGIPRRINQICSRLFLHGSIEEKHRLGIADLKIIVKELQQESLLPMDKAGINEADPWPAEQYEETYQEEPKTSPPAPKTVLPSTETLPGTERAEQKPSTMAADTRLHIPARVPVSVAGRGPRAGDNQASIHQQIRRWQSKLLALVAALGRPAVWSGAATVLVLITALLAAYFSDGDSDQPLPDQDILALNQAGTQHQAGTQQLVQPASEDREVPSVQPQPETPAPEEQARSVIRNSASEAGNKTWRGKEIFAALEPDPIETSLPASRSDIVEPDITPAADTTNDETADQSEPSQDEPAPVREAAPVIALSQGSQAKKAADPVPVKQVTVAPPISKEEKIAEFLDHGRRSLRRDRLLFPENNNAYHYFQRVLKLDPRNSDARHGIEQVAARYTTLATEALDKNDKKKAERYIARGFRVSPKDEGLRALRERMNAPPVKVAAEQPPPIVAAPEPEPEGLFKRFKAIFARQPNEKIENQTQTDEP
jgi:type II secretory pathway predicted ATPase ExeA